MKYTSRHNDVGLTLTVLRQLELSSGPWDSAKFHSAQTRNKASTRVFYLLKVPSAVTLSQFRF